MIETFITRSDSWKILICPCQDLAGPSLRHYNVQYIWARSAEEYRIATNPFDAPEALLVNNLKIMQYLLPSYFSVHISLAAPSALRNEKFRYCWQKKMEQTRKQKILFITYERIVLIYSMYIYPTFRRDT